MTRQKDITFEGNSLTGVNGFDTTSGTEISVISTTPIKDTFYGHVAATGGAASYGQEDWTATNDGFASAYFRFPTNPAGIINFLELRDGSSALARVRFTVTGGASLRLVDSAGATIGTDFAVTANTIYRIGLHYTIGSGANGVVEMFVATGDSAFGAADRSTTANSGITQVSRLRCGVTTAATFTVDFDDIRIDDTTMPGPSVASASDAPFWNQGPRSFMALIGR
jgi:hypothetical protein